MSKLKYIHLHPNTFTKNCKLRFLEFYSSIDDREYECKLSNFQGLILAQARYFHWHDDKSMK